MMEMRLPSNASGPPYAPAAKNQPARMGDQRRRMRERRTYCMILQPLLGWGRMTSQERERYSRQILFPGIGEEGQERLRAARVAVVGCGALGSFHAAALARAGVGRLVLIDRDYVETSNLQRQWLYEEADAADGLPKAIAAQRALAASTPAWRSRRMSRT